MAVISMPKCRKQRAIVHKCMVPARSYRNELPLWHLMENMRSGSYDHVKIGRWNGKAVNNDQRWPIRVPRPVHDRIPACVPTGNRARGYWIQCFPVPKGGDCSNFKVVWYWKDNDTASRLRNGPMRILSIISDAGQ